MIIGLVIDIDRGIDVYGGSEVVVEGVDVGYLGLRVTNHIYIVCI